MTDEMEAKAKAAALSSTTQGNLDVVASFHEREEAEVTQLQLAIERVSDFFGSPLYFAFAVLFMISWIGLNSWGNIAGWRHVDEPPFFLLQGIVSANALLLTIAVLIRQRRMSQVAEHRSHLDLQVNLLTEHKVAKLFQLLDQRLGGATSAASDPEIDQLAKPADAEALLHAIKRQAENH